MSELERGVRLDEFDKDEWKEVAFSVRPDWTEEKFEEAWGEFWKMMERRQLQ